MSLTTLKLSKQNFKFSSGHFLIFDSHRAEKLHGHNYQVRVEIQIPSEDSLESTGYFVDFAEFKKIIKAKLDQWDEQVLLPKLQKEMSFEINHQNLEVRFRERFYSFPKNEVVLLPVMNTSVEQLSKLLAEDLLRELQKFGVQEIAVEVEETPGQSAQFRAKT